MVACWATANSTQDEVRQPVERVVDLAAEEGKEEGTRVDRNARAAAAIYVDDDVEDDEDGATKEQGHNDADDDAAVRAEYEKLEKLWSYTTHVRRANKTNATYASPITSFNAEWEKEGGWDRLKRGPELHWWFKHHTEFESLAPFARMILAIPASSSGAERLSSSSGKTVSPHRSRLTPENVCMKTMIKDNYHHGLLSVHGYSNTVLGKRKARGKEGPIEDEEDGADEGEVEEVEGVERRVMEVLPQVDRRSSRIANRPTGRRTNAQYYEEDEIEAATSLVTFRDDLCRQLHHSAEGMLSAADQYQDHPIQTTYGQMWQI